MVLRKISEKGGSGRYQKGQHNRRSSLVLGDVAGQYVHANAEGGSNAQRRQIVGVQYPSQFAIVRSGRAVTVDREDFLSRQNLPA